MFLQVHCRNALGTVLSVVPCCFFTAAIKVCVEGPYRVRQTQAVQSARVFSLLSDLAQHYLPRRLQIPNV